MIKNILEWPFNNILSKQIQGLSAHRPLDSQVPYLTSRTSPLLSEFRPAANVRRQTRQRTLDLRNGGGRCPARERRASIRHKFASWQEEGHRVASGQSPSGHSSSCEVARGQNRATQPARRQAVVQPVGGGESCAAAGAAAPVHAARRSSTHTSGTCSLKLPAGGAEEARRHGEEGGPLPSVKPFPL